LLLPKSNVEYYTGLEYMTFQINPNNTHVWEIYFDYDISPGYFSWVAPINSKLSHVGLVKKNQ
jgi:flavin-dependent dehydrogenase